MVFVGLAFAGLVVIASCAVQVYLGVRGLGRELQRTGRRLGPKRSALEMATRRLDRTRE